MASCTKTNPCVLCGRTDWCWWKDYGEGGILRFCSQIKQDTVYGSDGEIYLLKDNKKFPGGVSNGGYYVYESKSQQEEQKARWIEEQKRTNPNWKSYNNGHSSKSYHVSSIVPKTRKPRKHVDVIVPLSNKHLDAVYRYLLELLVLEDNHRAALVSEWNCGPDKTLADRIFSIWPIKSLPMNDRGRKAGGYTLKNRTRREIIDALVKKFGSLRGVPGFFMETVTYMDKFTGQEREYSYWQMVNLSGIVYPAFDSDGYLYRIRIGDEHPTLNEYAKDVSGNYIFETNPQTGRTQHKICAEYHFIPWTGEWVRKDLFTGEEHLVYSRQKNIFLVTITNKGYPKIDGDVDGKYKNFSSYSEKDVETDEAVLVYNTYPEGCRSGSPISLYAKEGDNFQFVYVTEGEKKAKVINAILNCPVISLPGVNNYNKLFEKEYQKLYSMLDRLVERGMKYIIIVYDSDKTTNTQVLNSEANAIKACKEHGITTLVGSWDARYGKGSDDILIQGKWFECYEADG